MNRVQYARFAWGFLAYNLAVILWGAYVRASRSGDGCGNHWPHCGSSQLPQDHAAAAATKIEFAHRLSTSILIPICIALAVWAFRHFPKGDANRKAVVAVGIFTVIEGLLGAVLVKGGYTGDNASVMRAVVLSLHLVNTFLLITSLSLMAWWAGGAPRLQLKGQGPMAWALGFCLVAVMGLAVTGVIAALGDTLFPSTSLAEGLRQDAAYNASYLIKHRPAHPNTALCVGLLLVLMAGLVERLRPSPATRNLARWVVALLISQISLGIINLLLLAPPWMQIVHLLVADLMWIALVLLGAAAFAEGVPMVEAMSTEAITGRPTAVATGTASWRDYVALTKPRVISLLLFTTMTAMIMAQPGWPGFWLFTATSVGLYMAAGAANAINMVLERDLDLRMERTASRPTVTHQVPPRAALWFAFALEAGSFLILWRAANLLAAMLAFSGLVVYVIVYTILLKRRTWSNIVIGGAAGAFPPLVGWAAVAGNLSPLAWCLFALIFVWTPVHFWALALLIKDDYAKAGVPMLPVVRGDRHTVAQIAVYAVVTVVFSALPFILRDQNGQASAGAIYLGSAILLNLLLVGQSLQLYKQTDRPHASRLFHYSMLYLALLFLALAVDRAKTGHKAVEVTQIRLDKSAYPC